MIASSHLPACPLIVSAGIAVLMVMADVQFLSAQVQQNPQTATPGAGLVDRADSRRQTKPRRPAQQKQRKKQTDAAQRSSDLFGDDLGTSIPMPDYNFSFIHMSDTHVEPYPTTAPESLQEARSYTGIQTIAEVGPIPMPPFQVTAPRPSFAIVTGDVTEFGFPGVTSTVVDQYFDHLRLPIYLSTGNHDNTQVAMPSYWRGRYGGQNYSFDKEGCHFIALNSASLQDPNPSFAEEVLTFLEQDLKSVKPSTPVFVYCHHPPDGGEFASRYDGERILDALRRHNVTLFLVGHGHSSVTHNFAGIDGVMGGSTFLARTQKKGQDGYGVCYLKGNKLHYAYKSFQDAEANKRMIEKIIAPFSSYPVISITSPIQYSTVKGDRFAITVGVGLTSGSIASAEWSLDDRTTGALNITGKALFASVPTAGLDHGAHHLRISFTDSAGRAAQRSTAFYLEPSTTGGDQADVTTAPKPSAKWRYRMGAASKCRPLVSDGKVYLGANDGKLRALNAETGKLVWEFDAGAEILTSVVRTEDLLLFGDGNGIFHARQISTGGEAWTYDAGAAIYSSPVIGPDGEVYFGNNKAELIALNAADGALLWKNTDAQYSVESAPTVRGQYVYFGAWDGKLYCVDRKSGKTVWKNQSPWNQAEKRSVRYYAPADAPFVATDDRLFVVDRGYLAGVYQPATGDFQTTISSDCSAIALAADGQHLFARGMKSPLTKIGIDGQEVWRSEVTLGRIPVPPTVVDNMLYACTNAGLLHAIDSGTGKVLWKYQVSPGLYVMAPVAVENGVVYTVGFDGVVTAVELSKESTTNVGKPKTGSRGASRSRRAIR